MKRYCQTLTLVDDEEMIEKYCEVHAHVWPEVIAGQHQVGILSMQIYRQGRQLFMITDTVDDFDFERDMARLRGVRRCLPQHPRLPYRLRIIRRRRLGGEVCLEEGTASLSNNISAYD